MDDSSSRKTQLVGGVQSANKAAGEASNEVPSETSTVAMSENQAAEQVAKVTNQAKKAKLAAEAEHSSKLNKDEQLTQRQPADAAEQTSVGKSNSFLARMFSKLIDAPQTAADLIDLLRDAQRHNIINADALEMIEGVMSVSSMQVRDIMIPRAHMIAINKEDQPREFLTKVLESGHSRFPVISDSRDDVVGMLLAKDLLSLADDTERNFRVADFLRPVAFVPESKRLNVLLREFRLSRNHMAIVVDEYGGVSGLVTIEDVLEQIVGEIDDEHDSDDEKYIMRRGPNNYAVKALTPIEDFNERFRTELVDNEFDTIGGLVMNSLGRLPRRGEAVTMHGLQFRVVRVDSRRIHMLQVRPVVDE